MKVYKFNVWENGIEGYDEVFVIAESEDEAAEKLVENISYDNFDYEIDEDFMEEFEDTKVILQ